MQEIMNGYDKLTLTIGGVSWACGPLIKELDNLALRLEEGSQKDSSGPYTYSINNRTRYGQFTSYLVSRSVELGPDIMFTLRLDANPDKELRVCAGKVECVHEPIHPAGSGNLEGSPGLEAKVDRPGQYNCVARGI